MNVKPLALALSMSLAGVAVVGCASFPTSENQKENLEDNGQVALKKMQRMDPGLRDRLDRAAGYAIFPDASSAGFIVGGKSGVGEVYEKGTLIGYAKIEEGNIGLQVGGKTFNELVIFEDQATLDRFKQGRWAPSANASAVVLRTGTGVSAAPFKDGVLIVVDVEGGAMAEASVGAQKFSYRAK
ncbi:MAG TPA: hypothetical protein VF796_03620 [Humisphaera sp.]